MSAVAVSAATVTPSVAVAAATRLPPPLPPTLRCITVQARTISIEWTSNFNPASDSTEETSIKLLDSDTMLHIQYQLSKSEENSGVYQVVYEGGARTFNISSLIPLTKYTFKLRVKWDDDPEDNWSKSSTQIEVKTTDEAEIANAYTELYRAVKDSKTHSVQQILTKFGKQLDLNTRDKSGYTLLMIACQSSSFDVVNLLLNAGASPKETTRSGKTPISIAVTYGNLRAVQCLIANNIDVNAADQGGSSPLMWGCEHAGSNKAALDIIELLIRGGAVLDAEDVQGRTALDRLCASSGNAKAADVLLNHGARQILSCSETHPRTTLMIASMNGHRDLCKLLLTKHGAKLEEKTIYGYDAYDVAKSSGHQNVVEFFEQFIKPK